MFVHECCRWFRRVISNQAKRKNRQPNCLPLVEALESRYAPAVYRVTNLTDGPSGPITGAGTSQDPFLGYTLRGAMDDVNANHAAEANTIRLTGGATYTLTIDQLSANLNTAGSLTILTVGSGRATVERDTSFSPFRIFEFSSDTTAVLQNLVVTKGEIDNFSGDVSGGGILNHGNLTITNSIVTDNHVATLFTDSGSNTATGGGIASDGPLTIKSSTISNNSSQSGANGFLGLTDGDARGGGIGLFGSGARLSLTSSTVTGNEVRSKFSGVAAGGGISEDGGISINIQTSTISDNKALGGEGIDNDGTPVDGGLAKGGGLSTGLAGTRSTFLIFRSTFSGNSAIGGAGATSTLAPSRGGDGLGGGLDLQSHGTLRIIDCTISGNLAQGGRGGSGEPNGNGQGGGIYHYSTGASIGHFVNLTITQNRALNDVNRGNGGGIYNRSSGATALRVWNTIVAQNYVNVGRNEAISGSDVVGAFISKPSLKSGHNLIGNRSGSTGFGAKGSGDIVGPPIVSAGLRSLAFNGGPTQTHLLTKTSKAFNAGDNAVLAFFKSLGLSQIDQRGVPRKNGPAVDIGAVELITTPVPPPVIVIINRRWDR